MVLLALAAAACRPVQPEVLRVASSGDYPPFSIATDGGKVNGLDAIVARRFAHDTGRAASFVRLRWPLLIEGARAGSFDVAMSGVTLRADRLFHLAFSRPYAITGAVLVLRRERAKNLGSPAASGGRGLHLAVNRGGHLENIARTRFPHAIIAAVDMNAELPDLVLAGKVDAAVSEQHEAAAWSHPQLVTIGPFTRDRKAYAVAPDRVELLEELNAWLAARENDGWLNDQRRRWLGESAVWTPERACFEAIAAAIDMRMQLMPWIAMAKRLRGMPIGDPPREREVLAAARGHAVDLGLDPGAAALLFGDLIESGKAAQQATETREIAASDRTDLGAVRAILALQSRQILVEAARCRPALRREDSRELLESVLREGIAAHSLVDPVRLASRLGDL